MNGTRISALILITILAGILPHGSFSQCNLLRPQRDIQFNTDQDCAPSTVTNFTIRYFFNAPQVPADIVIHFEWNDLGGSFTNIDISTGLLSFVGNTEFQATGTFMQELMWALILEMAILILVLGFKLEADGTGVKNGA